jgi:hypothetical protein
MSDSESLVDDPFWQRLADYERDQFRDYAELVFRGPRSHMSRLQRQPATRIHAALG